MEAARLLDQMKSDGIVSASADEIKQASVKQPIGRVQVLAAFNQPGGLARRDDAYTAEPGDHHHFVGLYTPAGFKPPAAGSSPVCDLLLMMARCSINEDPNLIGTPFAVDAGALGGNVFPSARVMDVPSKHGTLESLSCELPSPPSDHPPTYRVNQSVSTFYSYMTPLLGELAAAAPDRLIAPVFINVRHHCGQKIVIINGVIYILCDDGDLERFAAALRVILEGVIAKLDARKIALAPTVLQLTFTEQLRDGKAKAGASTKAKLSSSKCVVDQMLAKLTSTLGTSTGYCPLIERLRLNMDHMGWSRKAQVVSENADGSKKLGAPDLVKQTESTFALLTAARSQFESTPQSQALFTVGCLLSGLEDGCSDKAFSAADAACIAAELRAAAVQPEEPVVAVIELAIKHRVLTWSKGFNPHFAGTGGLKRLKAEQAALAANGLKLECAECDDDDAKEVAFQKLLKAEATAAQLERVFKEVTQDGKKGLHGGPRFERLFQEASIELVAHAADWLAVPCPLPRSLKGRASTLAQAADAPLRRAMVLVHVLHGLDGSIKEAETKAVQTSLGRAGDKGATAAATALEEAKAAEAKAKTEAERATLAKATKEAAEKAAAATATKEACSKKKADGGQEIGTRIRASAAYADPSTTTRNDLRTDLTDLSDDALSKLSCEGCGRSARQWLSDGGGSGVNPPTTPGAACTKQAWNKHCFNCRKANGVDATSANRK